VASKDSFDIYQSEKALLHEDELVVQLEKAVELLESLGKTVTQIGVSKIMVCLHLLYITIQGLFPG